MTEMLFETALFRTLAMFGYDVVSGLGFTKVGKKAAMPAALSPEPPSPKHHRGAYRLPCM